MLGFFAKWFLLSLVIWCGFNWFLVQSIAWFTLNGYWHISWWQSVGAAGLGMILVLIFGSNK